ncbi:RluA family pseudouridine synthase [Verrucomicrobiota bacterium]
MSKRFGSPRHRRMKGLEIIYEDRDLLVICKEPGLLTMSYHRDQDATAERMLTSYLRKGNSRSRLRAYTVHRLDRDTSGLLVFAKTEAVQQKLKNNWPVTEKRYTAVVHGHLDEPEGTISSYLAENEDQYVHSTRNAATGKWSETQYNVVKESAHFSQLDIKLLTGRKNQIRVHFAEAGHPLVGDKKYGKKGDRAERMALHARYLSFPHPHSGKRMEFEAPIPEAILRMVK